MINKLGEWLVEYRCSSCGCEVTETQRSYCKCCPNCGELAKCTFLKTTEHVYREQTSYEQTNARVWWWQFWIPREIKIVKRVYKDAQ